MPPPRALLHCGSLAQLKRLKPLYLMLRPRAVYLVDFACFRTKPNCRVSFATFLEHSRVWPGFDGRSVWFMTWLLERFGLGEETCLPYVQYYIPPSRDLKSSRAEAELVIFSVIDDLLAKTGRRERAQGGAPPQPPRVRVEGSSAPAARGRGRRRALPGRHGHACGGAPPGHRERERGRASSASVRAWASELYPGIGAVRGWRVARRKVEPGR